MLNETERKIMMGFLDDLANNMSNAGCNDYELPDNEEGRSIAKEVAADLQEDEPRLMTYDWAVLEVLRRKLRLTHP